MFYLLFKANETDERFIIRHDNKETAIRQRPNATYIRESNETEHRSRLFDDQNPIDNERLFTGC